MNIFKKLSSAYIVDYPKVLAYMWQSSEYDVKHMADWWMRAGDFRKVTKRGSLVPTPAGKLVRLICGVVALTYLLLSVLIIMYVAPSILGITLSSLALIIAYPAYVAILSTLPVRLLRLFVFLPKQKKAIARATKIFTNHPGTVIAVAGSYGKTTMKELLASVLGSSNKVGFTEGNKNTLLSQAKFADSLTGSEDYVIVEFGEGASGDVGNMTAMVSPDYAVITGLAPNHLDHYKDIDDIAHDFTALLAKVGVGKAFINGDSPLLFEKLSTLAKSYTSAGCLNRWVQDETLQVNHTSFALMGCDEQIEITSGLVGRHNIATLAFVAAFARELGVSKKDIEKSLQESKPYEHRMEPRAFHGGWLIDDTYNGSIEGMKAGLSLLSELKTAGRKIYVTPGLVDQGVETEAVHEMLGKLIALSKPDMLYLMNNSVHEIVMNSATKNGYEGIIKVVDEPLEFYTHLENIIAKDDIIMCQNDWPDNYQ